MSDNAIIEINNWLCFLIKELLNFPAKQKKALISL